MTGLNLETLLRLLRADMGAWTSLGVVAAILAVMTWTSWGSKRALRKCLFLSIAAHVGLIVYGGSSPEFRKALRLGAASQPPPRPERPLRVTPWIVEKSTTSPEGRPKPQVAAWDLDRGPLALAEPGRLIAPPGSLPAPILNRNEPEPVTTPAVAPEIRPPSPSVVVPVVMAPSRAPEPPSGVTEADVSEVAAPVEVAAPDGALDVPVP